MVNIKFSTRYLVDLLFSRQITSSRRIRPASHTARKRSVRCRLLGLTTKYCDNGLFLLRGKFSSKS
jgi:hypothetical protein